jgi:hypothetical protein
MLSANAQIWEAFCLRSGQQGALGDAKADSRRAMIESDSLTRAKRLATEIADAILNGKLSPGTRLDEQKLAEQYGVSRTPVREALRQLGTDLNPGNWTGQSGNFPVISPGWEKGTDHEGVQVFGAADCCSAQADR